MKRYKSDQKGSDEGKNDQAGGEERSRSSRLIATAIAFRHRGGGDGDGVVVEGRRDINIGLRGTRVGSARSGSDDEGRAVAVEIESESTPGEALRDRGHSGPGCIGARVAKGGITCDHSHVEDLGSVVPVVEVAVALHNRVYAGGGVEMVGANRP